MTGPVLVVGATGTVGSPLVEALLQLDPAVQVRAASRHPRPAEGNGRVEPVRLDLTEPGTWDAAFAGVETLFLVRPPALSRPDHDLLPALEHAISLGLRHVVFLSVQGAERLRVIPHARIERWLRSSGLGWTFLRASFFDQNLLTVHGADLRERSEIVVPAGRGRTAFVDAVDVAEVGARVLLEPERHRDRAYTVTGSESLTYAEVAAILSATLGRPIVYPQPGLLRYVVHAHRRLGMPLGLAVVSSVIYTTARLGFAGGLSGDTASLLGRPPTTLAEFAAREVAAFTPSAA